MLLIVCSETSAFSESSNCDQPPCHHVQKVYNHRYPYLRLHRVLRRADAPHVREQYDCFSCIRINRTDPSEFVRAFPAGDIPGERDDPVGRYFFTMCPQPPYNFVVGVILKPCNEMDALVAELGELPVVVVSFVERKDAQRKSFLHKPIVVASTA